LAHERQVINMPEPFLVNDPKPNQWLPLLDVEIQRLPERLRVPVVLCELQGMTRGMAAQQLGIPEGTLSSRLARGRGLLRKRLQRSGVFVGSAALTAAFLQGSEAIAASLLTETTRAALSGATSASVAALTQGVLKTMLLVKLKIASIAVLTLGIATGALVAAHSALVPAEKAKTEKARAEEAKSDKDKLQGKWEIVSASDAGKEVEGDEGQRIKMNQVVFTGGKVKFKEEAEYSIDPRKKPKEMDLKVKTGPEREQGTYQGIYTLSDDELTLCFGGPKAVRPTEFVSKRGEKDDPASAVMLLKLKRVK
jgi:uncharacterized protein (TIGR03067 family)